MIFRLEGNVVALRAGLDTWDQNVCGVTTRRGLGVAGSAAQGGVRFMLETRMWHPHGCKFRGSDLRRVATRRRSIIDLVAFFARFSPEQLLGDVNLFIQPLLR